MSSNDNNNKTPLNEGASMEEILASIRRAMQDKPQEEMVQSEEKCEDILDLQPDSPPLHSAASEPLSTARRLEPEPELNQRTFVNRDVEERTKELLSQLDHEVQRKQKQSFEESYMALERILRPILKEWCNQHLPEIVARSVQKEIKLLVRTLTQRDYG